MARRRRLDASRRDLHERRRNKPTETQTEEEAVGKHVEAQKEDACGAREKRKEETSGKEKDFS